MTKETLTNIILVEDDPDIQQIAKLALCSIGKFSVQIFSSGIDILEQASSLHPQLILLDVMMPNMDGPTTLSKLREIPHLATTPVIFLTAKVQSHELENYKKLGAIDVISKPFDPMTLSSSILDIWSKNNT